MGQSFYLNRLYPFQDQVPRDFSGIDTGFYLAGGTALSRVHLNHRFSDDIDLLKYLTLTRFGAPLSRLNLSTKYFICGLASAFAPALPRRGWARSRCSGTGAC